MPRHRLPSLTLGSLLLALCLASPLARPARAGTKDPSAGKPVPSVFDKAIPESVQELKAIQEHVRALVKRVVPATVNVRIGPGQGSGVIVSEDGYILTAGHVAGAPDRKVTVTLPGGRQVKGITLGVNRGIDSGLIKITDEGKWPHVEMGDSSKLKKGQWCLAVGHPTGYKKGRSPVVRLGRVLDSGKVLIRTDCTLVGGDSGGPLFDMDGKVIGIHSRIAGPLTANIHVPVDSYRETWDRLAKGESWGGGLFGQDTQPYLGVAPDPESKDCKIGEVYPDSPAAKAGLKVNDVVLRFAGKRISAFDDLRSQVLRRKPGERVRVEVQRGDETVNLDVVVGKRPD